VQAEGDRSREHVALGQAGELGLEQVGARLQRGAEPGLLPLDEAGDRVLVRADLGVGVAHQLDGGADHRRGHELLDAEEVGEAHGPADDAAQHVAAVLVAGQHAVVDEEGDGAGVVGEEAQGHVGLRVVAEAAPGDRLRPLDEAGQHVGLVHRRDALQHAEVALEPGAGVDAPHGRSAEAAVGLAEVLREHEVPELDVALLGPVRGTALGAEVGPEVPEDLRARPARAGLPHLPEVVLVEPLDARTREADGRRARSARPRRRRRGP
jgi:hypothetical protein